MKIKSSELKKLINEAIDTEMKALLKEGYTQEQLDEIDFSKVGNFFKGAARGVKDLAVDTKKNYFDNSDLNLESEIKKLTKIYMTLSEEVGDLTENLSSMKQELKDLQRTIKEKKSQLEKIKKERGSDPYFKKYSHEDRYKNEKKPVSKKEPESKESTPEPEKSKPSIDVNKDASTFEKDPKSGQRFRRKMQEMKLKRSLNK
jgi:paraquat-inducible protein B